MIQAKNIKVIGYPFAKSSLGQGSAKTPAWLFSQQWFQKLSTTPRNGIEFETV